jgi:hypothetical protein
MFSEEKAEENELTIEKVQKERKAYFPSINLSIIFRSSSRGTNPLHRYSILVTKIIKYFV